MDRACEYCKSRVLLLDGALAETADRETADYRCTGCDRQYRFTVRDNFSNAREGWVVKADPTQTFWSKLPGEKIPQIVYGNTGASKAATQTTARRASPIAYVIAGVLVLGLVLYLVMR